MLSSSSSSPARKRVKSIHHEVVDLTNSTSGEWSCSKCTLLNSEMMVKCQLCDMARSDPAHNPPVQRIVVSIESARDLYVSGIMPLLERRSPRTSTKAVILSSPPPHHFTQLFQEGKYWSCGYRNIQILCSSCMQIEEINRVICGGEIPSIPSIQRYLELAWQQGFDEEGGRHFEFQLVGKKKWIGATECVVFFRYFGLETQVYDFLPDNLTASKALQIINVRKKVERFLNDYYSDGKIERLPLYFQQSGHSRTIIGIEKLMNGSGTLAVQNMLIFDPASDGRTIKSSLQDETTLRWRSSLCRSLDTLKDVKYQIVSVTSRMMSDIEREQSKILRGVLYSYHK